MLEAAGDAPAFLYNIPPRTVNDLEPALAGELARAGFAGMKDSTGDLARHQAYLEAVGRTPVRALHRHRAADPRLGPRGGDGSINALSNFRPELFIALRDALEAGDEAGPAARRTRSRS